MTLAWLFDEESQAEQIEPLLAGAELVVPWLWRLEVVNVVLVLVKERRKLLTVAQATHLLELLEDWDVKVIDEPPARSLTGSAAVARPHQLSAYDAVYLDLAVSLGLPFFTRDSNLRAAAARIGVPLIAESTP